jgi:hypothetical protein
VEPFPLLFPAGRDRVDFHSREAGAELADALLVRVDDEAFLLLGEALGSKLEKLGDRLFGLPRGDGDRRAKQRQRKALFSLSKKPSSGR